MKRKFVCEKHAKMTPKSSPKLVKKSKNTKRKTPTKKHPNGANRGLPKHGRKGGKGRDPGWNPPRKKKDTAKPNLLQERVHAGRKHADCDRSSTRPCGGPHPARGRIFWCILVAPWLTFGSLLAPLGSLLTPLRSLFPKKIENHVIYMHFGSIHFFGVVF